MPRFHGVRLRVEQRFLERKRRLEACYLMRKFGENCRRDIRGIADDQIKRRTGQTFQEIGPANRYIQ